jgi:hypothetical protein
MTLLPRRPELTDRLESDILADPARRACLDILRATLGSDAWIGAGFVRNPVWDRLIGDGHAHPPGDVDVLIFDPDSRGRDWEKAAEARLGAAAPPIDWQVRNQARMHLKHGDRPYTGIEDAMGFWLETATGIAVRRGGDGGLRIMTAYGLEDLYAGILRPTGPGARKLDALEDRMARKGWAARWPGLRYLPDAPAPWRDEADPPQADTARRQAGG